MTVPNYKKGVGRLATDLYDFKDHIDGYKFNHTANAITVSPAVSITTIGTATTVQEAIQFLNTAIDTDYDPDATTISKGRVQLSGDIGGTATNVAVIGLNGKPLSSAAPAEGDTLTWNSAIPQWEPNPIGAAIILNGDVTGSAAATVVSKLNGNPITNDAPSNGYTLAWDTTGTPTWKPKYLPISGDVTGDSNTTLVTKIQGRQVSSSAPSTNHTLYWDGTSWAPGYLTIAGDVTGDSGNTTVSKIQGNSISASAPSTNNTLIWSGTDWTPQTPSIAGDVTGALASSTVVAIQGRSVNTTAPTSNQTLNWNSVGNYWIPQSFSTLYRQKSTTYLYSNIRGINPDTDILEGGWQAPPGVYFVMAEGYGGGGSGGNGADGLGGGSLDGFGPYERGIGGGGGGGAIRSTKIVSVVPGTWYNIIVGLGGAALTGGGENGGTGDDTIFAGAYWKGADGGQGGANLTHTPGTNLAGIAPGGTPTYSAAFVQAGKYNFTSFWNPPDFGRGPGFGGCGVDSGFNADGVGWLPQYGAFSIDGSNGGSSGSSGSSTMGSTYAGGGAGGGGAGGPGGNGGTGGTGGPGGETYSSNGGPGGIVIANSGAGGGGGGSAGNVTEFYPTLLGGKGGNGGSGKLIITWWDSE
jgi:hypothetical protein